MTVPSNAAPDSTTSKTPTPTALATNSTPNDSVGTSHAQSGMIFPLRMSCGHVPLRFRTTEHGEIDRRQEHKRQHGSHEQSTHDGEGHRPPEHGGCDWNEAENGRNG